LPEITVGTGKKIGLAIARGVIDTSVLAAGIAGFKSGEEAELVDVRFATDVSPDPGDNPFCACAAAARGFHCHSKPDELPSKASVGEGDLTG